MKKYFYDIFIWVMTIVLCVSIFFYPETVPIHWNGNWEVDGYGSRYTMLIFALLPIVIYYGMLLTKKIDPKYKNLQKNGKTYETIRKVLSFFFVLFGIFFYYLTANPKSDGSIMIGLLLGGMLVVFGNYMPKVPKNYFLGIRTPWTLASEIVWKKTHKIGGYLYVISGVMVVIWSLFFPQMYGVVLAVILVSSAIIFIYSYLEFRKIDKEKV